MTTCWEKFNFEWWDPTILYVSLVFMGPHYGSVSLLKKVNFS